MEKIIFLDIDGVLNCQSTFDETKGYRNSFNLLLNKEKNDKKWQKLYFKKYY